jgi:hypothetical protein
MNVAKGDDMSVLDGKKTKLTGLAMVLYGVGGFLAGFHDANTAVEMVFEGLGFVFVRIAIEGKEGSGV